MVSLIFQVADSSYVVCITVEKEQAQLHLPSTGFSAVELESDTFIYVVERRSINLSIHPSRSFVYDVFSYSFYAPISCRLVELWVDDLTKRNKS